MITLTEKLTNLKYELLMAYSDRDIQFPSSALAEYRNIIIYEIFTLAGKIIIRSVRMCVSEVQINFIATL